MWYHHYPYIEAGHKLPYHVPYWPPCCPMSPAALLPACPLPVSRDSGSCRPVASLELPQATASSVDSGGRSKPMITTKTTPGIPPDLAAEFQEALDDLAKGIRRPEKMQAACERMDRLREENRRLLGEQNSAVELIRQTRDDA